MHGQNAESTARQVRDLWLSHRQEDAIASVVRDYVNAEKPTLAGRIIATADAATAVRLNTRAQDMRLGDGSFDPTQGIAHDRILLHVGDRVQFGRTDAELGVKDRELGDVVAIFPQFRTIAVAIDERKLPGAEVVLLSLNEYPDIDLAYATTYDRAKHMELHQVFVLADSRAPTRQFVESLPAFHLQVYADAVTASKCFPEHADGHYRCPSVDLNADPLGAYRQRE